MRVAIPLANGKVATHFGHCERFIFYDTENNLIVNKEAADAPPHQPGLLPEWLASQGTQVIIAGGMGQRALQLFARSGIQVVVGAPCCEPECAIAGYLAGTLDAGDNICDH